MIHSFDPRDASKGAIAGRFVIGAGCAEY